MSEGSDVKIAFWENAVFPLPEMRPDEMETPLRRAFVMLGPEGGFTEKEMDMAMAAGFHVATLGPRILRAETAALVACGLIQYIYGDLSSVYT